MRPTYLIALFVSISCTALGDTPKEITPYEQAQLQIEHQKLDQANSALEWTKALGSWLPLAAALYAFVSLRKTLEAQALTKAIELALDATSPEEAHNRISLIARLLKGSLPKDFEERLQDSRSKLQALRSVPPYILDARSTLIRALAEFPMQRDQILRDWIACFGPGDGWAVRVQKAGATAQEGVAPTTPAASGSTIDTTLYGKGETCMTANAQLRATMPVGVTLSRCQYCGAVGRLRRMRGVFPLNPRTRNAQ